MSNEWIACINDLSTCLGYCCGTFFFVFLVKVIFGRGDG